MSSAGLPQIDQDTAVIALQILSTEEQKKADRLKTPKILQKTGPLKHVTRFGGGCEN